MIHAIWLARSPEIRRLRVGWKQNESWYGECRLESDGTQKEHQRDRRGHRRVSAQAHGSDGGAGGRGFGLGPDRVDIDSDLRGQTRLLTNCPTHKYNPQSYAYCSNCKNCNLGLPCGCRHCKTKDVSNLSDCRPGIIPVESLDTRSFDGCNDLNAFYINRWDHLCHNPQSPQRIFHYAGNRRLGANTQLDMKDYSSQCVNAKLPDRMPCATGQLGCRHNKDFASNIFR